MTREEAITKVNKVVTDFMNGPCRPDNPEHDASIWLSGAMFAIDLFTKQHNLSVEDFIEHVKISGALTEEGREYIDMRDVRLIIEMLERK